MTPHQSSFMGGIALGLAIGLIIGLLAYLSVNISWAQQAVKVGAAEYVIVNPQTGATEFRWKTP